MKLQVRLEETWSRTVDIDLSEADEYELRERLKLADGEQPTMRQIQKYLQETAHDYDAWTGQIKPLDPFEADLDDFIVAAVALHGEQRLGPMYLTPEPGTIGADPNKGLRI